MNLRVIAYARNGHTDKFGIPRQSREESPILTRIVFEPEFAVREALRGIEGFSHLWLLWGFSGKESFNSSEPVETPTKLCQNPVQSTTDWSPTVRPPRLGGNKRVGVFATRSPFRPNPIGLSSVRLISIQQSVISHQLELIVSGADVLDGTPIYDIKPYLSFSDSHPDAQNGFAEETKNRIFEVEHRIGDDPGLPPMLPRDYPVAEISYILSQDPRPGYQDDPEREYKMDYGGFRVTFIAQPPKIIVKNVEKL